MHNDSRAIVNNCYTIEGLDHAYDVKSIFHVAQLFIAKERRLCSNMAKLLEQKLIIIAREDVPQARDLCRQLKGQTQHKELGTLLHERELFFTSILAPHDAAPATARTSGELYLILRQAHHSAREPFHPEITPVMTDTIAVSLTQSLTHFASNLDVAPYCRAFENTTDSLRHLPNQGPTGESLRKVLQQRIEDHFVAAALDLFRKSTNGNVKRTCPWEIVANPVLKNVVRIVVNTKESNTRSRASFALRTMFDQIKKENPKAMDWLNAHYMVGPKPSRHLTSITDAYKPWKMLTRAEKIQRGKEALIRMLDI